MFLDSFVKIFAHLDYRALIDNNDNFLILKSTVPACVVCYASEIAGLGSVSSKRRRFGNSLKTSHVGHFGFVPHNIYRESKLLEGFSLFTGVESLTWHSGHQRTVRVGSLIRP